MRLVVAIRVLHGPAHGPGQASMIVSGPGAGLKLAGPGW